MCCGHAELGSWCQTVPMEDHTVPEHACIRQVPNNSFWSSRAGVRCVTLTEVSQCLMGVKIPGTQLAFGPARLFCVTLNKVDILHSVPVKAGWRESCIQCHLFCSNPQVGKFALPSPVCSSSEIVCQIGCQSVLLVGCRLMHCIPGDVSITAVHSQLSEISHSDGPSHHMGGSLQ